MQVLGEMQQLSQRDQHLQVNGSGETRWLDADGEPWQTHAHSYPGSFPQRAGMSTNNNHHVKKPKYRTVITIGESAKNRALERQGPSSDTRKAAIKRTHLTQSGIDHVVARGINNACGGIQGDNGGASRQLDTGRRSTTAAASWGKHVYVDGAGSLNNGVTMKGSATTAPVTNGTDHRETFHINEYAIMNGHSNGTMNGDLSLSLQQENEHPFDVSRRDIRNPQTLKETKIVSAKGTVRGIKNRVRAGIATFRENEIQDGQKKVRFETVVTL